MSGAHQNLDLERLARIIAMGGSGHDGEALAALRLADHSIRAAGMTWHDVLLPGRLIEGLVAQGERLRDELAALRAAKAAETKQLRDALAAVRRRRSPTHQRGPKGIIILCCLSVLVVAMYMIGDGIGDCVGGPVPVVNSPPDIARIAPPAPTASSGCIQRLSDVAGLSTNSFWRACDPPLPGGTAADPPPFSAPTADPPGGRW
jgi:hypothetical protein